MEGAEGNVPSPRGRRCGSPDYINLLGEFEVATGGGIWVAAGAHDTIAFVLASPSFMNLVASACIHAIFFANYTVSSDDKRRARFRGRQRRFVRERNNGRSYLGVAVEWRSGRIG